MSAFTELLADPFAEKSFVVSVRPCGDIAGSIAADSGTNTYVGVPGTFSGLIHGDRLLASGFAVSGNNGYAVVASVADGGSSIVVTGLALTTESAGSRRLYGEVARYYSTHGLTTSPSETPANTWYDGRVENALRFTRSLVDGDRIGGRSIPGFGSVVLQNLDGDMDPMRRWGWSGRSIIVEMGGPLFARSAYGVVFNGLTSGVQFDDRLVTISVTDLQGLLEQAPWRPVYLGTGGLEGGIDLKGTPKPLCYGPCRNVELVYIGIVGGRFAYQFHDGAVAAYDPAFHVVRDSGNPLTYEASNPVAGEWTLDASLGVITLGGSPIGTITADVKGDASGTGYVSSTSTIIRRVIDTRVALQSDLSVSSLLIGTGSRTLTVPPTMPFGTGGHALIAKEDDPDNYWMFGSVTAWNPTAGTLTVDVTRTAGIGTYASWGVTKIGLVSSEIDTASFATLDAANPASNCVVIKPDDTPIAVFDQVVNGIGAHYGFTRAGLFQVGRLEDTTGTPVIDLSGIDALELIREASRPPVWRQALGHKRNWRPLTGNDLAKEIRENVVTNGTFDSGTGWTAGTGWSIGSSKATAAAGSASDLSRTVNHIAGATYVLQFDITVAAGSLQPRIGATSIGAAVTTTQTVRREFTAAAATTTVVFSKDAAFAGDIDGVSITVREKAFLETEFRYTEPRSSMITRSIHGPVAISDRRDTNLDQEADAIVERDRQIGLHGVLRDIFQVPTKTQPFQLDVGALVSLSDPRFGLSQIRFRVLSIDEDAGDNRATVLLWG